MPIPARLRSLRRRSKLVVFSGGAALALSSSPAGAQADAAYQWSGWQTISGVPGEGHCSVEFATRKTHDVTSDGTRQWWYRARNHCSAEVIVRVSQTPNGQYPEEIAVGPGRTGTSYTYATAVNGAAVVRFRGRETEGGVAIGEEAGFPSRVAAARDLARRVLDEWLRQVRSVGTRALTRAENLPLGAVGDVTRDYANALRQADADARRLSDLLQNTSGAVTADLVRQLGEATRELQQHSETVQTQAPQVEAAAQRAEAESARRRADSVQAAANERLAALRERQREAAAERQQRVDEAQARVQALNKQSAAVQGAIGAVGDAINAELERRRIADERERAQRELREAREEAAEAEREVAEAQQEAAAARQQRAVAAGTGQSGEAPAWQNTWVTTVNASLTALNAQKPDSAAHLAERALILYKGDPLPYYVLASVAQNKGDVAAAARYWPRVAELAATDTSGQGRNLRSAALQNIAINATAAAQNAPAADRPSRAREAAAAIQAFLTAYPTSPETARMQTLRAQVVQIAGDEAATGARSTNQLVNPGKYDDLELTNAGVIAYQAGKKDDAAELFAAALERNRYQRDALNNLTAIYREQGKWSQEIPVAQRLIAIDPDNPDNYLFLAYAYQGLAKAAPAGPQKRAYIDSLVRYSRLTDEAPLKVTFTEFTRASSRATLGVRVDDRRKSGSATSSAPVSYDFIFEFLDAEGGVVEVARSRFGPLSPGASSNGTVIAQKSGITAFRYRRGS